VPPLPEHRACTIHAAWAVAFSICKTSSINLMSEKISVEGTASYVAPDD